MYKGLLFWPGTKGNDNLQGNRDGGRALKIGAQGDLRTGVPPRNPVYPSLDPRKILFTPSWTTQKGLLKMEKRRNRVFERDFWKIENRAQTLAVIGFGRFPEKLALKRTLARRAIHFRF